MPGHAHDPRFDDDTLAGLLTHLRRSWGHGDRPVSAATVARIDAVTAADVRAFAAHIAGTAPMALALYGPIATAPDLARLQQQRAA